MIKEVLLFAAGDVKDPSFWSNVPYLYCKTLEKRGIIVHNVNYNPPNWVVRLYNFLNWQYHRVIPTDYRRHFSQTIFAKWLCEPRIKKAIMKFNTSDCCIFIGSGYANFWSDVPSIIFSESCLEKIIKEDLKRDLSFWEKLVADQHRKAWNRASLVTMLFPKHLDFIKRIVPKANIVYKGTNVINTFYEGNMPSDIIQRKVKSKKILFIGGRHYIEGAKMVLKAFEILRKRDQDIRLDIVALTKEDFQYVPDGVTCHGYLNKADVKDRELYYELIFNARVFVNPTPYWGAYSSCIEAMFYYTPCVIAPYSHFVSEFGSDIKFGIYNYDFTPHGVSNSISKALYTTEYADMAEYAHERVKDYTWDNFIKWTFDELKKTSNNRC